MLKGPCSGCYGRGGEVDQLSGKSEGPKTALPVNVNWQKLSN